MLRIPNLKIQFAIFFHFPVNFQGVNKPCYDLSIRLFFIPAWWALGYIFRGAEFVVSQFAEYTLRDRNLIVACFSPRLMSIRFEGPSLVVAYFSPRLVSTRFAAQKCCFILTCLPTSS